MEQDIWLLELVLLAEEIKHGKGTPEKAKRLSELVLLLNAHLFDGENLPQAWHVPLITDFRPVTVPPEGPALENLDSDLLDEFGCDEPFEDSRSCEQSGVHDILDLSCFDDPARSLPPEDMADEDIFAA